MRADQQIDALVLHRKNHRRAAAAPYNACGLPISLFSVCCRSERTGFPEVVWGPGKTPLQIVTIMRKLAEQDQLAVASRIEPEVIHCNGFTATQVVVCLVLIQSTVRS